MITQEQQLRSLVKVVRELQAKEFYGELAVQFFGGNITIYKFGQTLKPEVAMEDGRSVVSFRNFECEVTNRQKKEK